MSEAYDMKKAIVNKMINEDGTVTDLQGNPVSSTNDAYNLAPAVPNKVLMPDGTYATLSEVINGGSVSADIFIVVDTLPDTGEENKIYLVPAQDGMFDEYYWNSNSKWDKLGTVDLSNCATKAEVEQALTDAKAYTDEVISNYVPMQSFDDYPSLVTDGTTMDLINSIKELNLPVGTLLLGQTMLDDMLDINPDKQMDNEEVRVEIYPQGVIRLIATSTNVPPYQWTYQYNPTNSESGWIATVISNSVDTQTVDTNIKIGNGKSISVVTSDGAASFTLSANADGSIKAIAKVGEETTEQQIAYASDINKIMTQMLAQAKLDAHPIGSLYWSKYDTDPSELFGGTWEQIKDTFVLAAGDTYEAGTTGGEATHTLTINEMPSHTHTFTGSSATTSSNGSHTHNIAQSVWIQQLNSYGSVNDQTSSGANGANIGTPVTTSSGSHTHTVTAKGTNSSTR